MAKKSKLVKVNVRISSERPSATVSFKEGKGGWRATSRGLPPLFVKATEKGAEARVRGENPVAARSPAMAFQRAVKTYWAD